MARNFEAIQNPEELRDVLAGATILHLSHDEAGVVLHCRSAGGETFKAVINSTLEVKTMDGEICIRPMLSFDLSNME